MRDLPNLVGSLLLAYTTRLSELFIGVFKRLCLGSENNPSSSSSSLNDPSSSPSDQLLKSPICYLPLQIELYQTITLYISQLTPLGGLLAQELIPQLLYQITSVVHTHTQTTSLSLYIYIYILATELIPHIYRFKKVLKIS